MTGYDGKPLYVGARVETHPTPVRLGYVGRYGVILSLNLHDPVRAVTIQEDSGKISTGSAGTFKAIAK